MTWDDNPTDDNERQWIEKENKKIEKKMGKKDNERCILYIVCHCCLQLTSMRKWLSIFPLNVFHNKSSFYCNTQTMNFNCFNRLERDNPFLALSNSPPLPPSLTTFFSFQTRFIFFFLFFFCSFSLSLMILFTLLELCVAFTRWRNSSILFCCWKS